MSFEDTSLNDIAALGGMGPVGSGSLGGTIWVTTAAGEIQQMEDTSLDNIAELGGMEPVGSGSLGATVWEVNEMHTSNPAFPVPVPPGGEVSPGLPVYGDGLYGEGVYGG